MCKVGVYKSKTQSLNTKQWRRIKENERAREGTGLAGTHLINPGQTPKLAISYKGTDKNIAKNAFVRHISCL